MFRIDGGSGRFAVKGSSNTIAKVDYQGKSELLVSERTGKLLPFHVETNISGPLSKLFSVFFIS